MNRLMIKKTLEGKLYITCQLGTKYGIPNLTPASLATKIWPSSCTPKVSAVTKAPGSPSLSNSRLSKVDLPQR